MTLVMIIVMIPSVVTHCTYRISRTNLALWKELVDQAPVAAMDSDFAIVVWSRFARTTANTADGLLPVRTLLPTCLNTSTYIHKRAFLPESDAFRILESRLGRRVGLLSLWVRAHRHQRLPG